MTRYTLLLPFVLLLLGSVSLQAQVSKEYVYVDSTLLYPDAKDSAAITDVEAPEDDAAVDTMSHAVSYAADTILLNNELTLLADSIRILKNSKQFAYAKVMDSLLKELQKQQVDASNMQPEKPSAFELFLSSGITRFIFWTLACFFVLFIIYKLFFTEGFLQRPSARTAVNLLNEDGTDGKGNVDYDKQVALAVSNQNYRLATRYLYLQTIQKLTAAGVIIFAADKTNSQYLYELTGKPYKNEFASLTLNYEYVWYGEFSIDEIAFAKLQNRFKQFNSQLKTS
jgi:hypothetical protein